MSSLEELVKKDKVTMEQLIEALERAISYEEGFGYVDPKNVVALLEKCSPPPVKKELERLKAICTQGERTLDDAGKSWQAGNYRTLLQAVNGMLR